MSYSQQNMTHGKQNASAKYDTLETRCSENSLMERLILSFLQSSSFVSIMCLIGSHFIINSDLFCPIERLSSLFFKSNWGIILGSIRKLYITEVQRIEMKLMPQNKKDRFRCEYIADYCSPSRKHMIFYENPV